MTAVESSESSLMSCTRNLQAAGSRARGWEVAGMMGPGKVLKEVGDRLEGLNKIIKARRFELRQWDQHAMEFEKAFTHEQVMKAIVNCRAAYCHCSRPEAAAATDANCHSCILPQLPTATLLPLNLFFFTVVTSRYLPILTHYHVRHGFIRFKGGTACRRLLISESRSSFCFCVFW